MNYATINILLKEKLQNLYPDREIESIGRLVLEHITGLSWVQIRLNQLREFTAEEEERIGEIIERLEQMEPVQYVLGETEFYGLPFHVRPGVLIPRGETEELVEWILVGTHNCVRFRGDVPASAGMTREVLEGTNNCVRPRFRGDDKGLCNDKLRVLDIGCGSGAIAIAIAKNMPDAEVFAADISEEALLLTQENALLNQVTIQTLHLDILSSLTLSLHSHFSSPRRRGRTQICVPTIFDIIISNPPYIPSAEMISMSPHVVNHEPGLALFVPDEDPLLFYRAIAEFAHTHLTPDGEVYVEIHDRFGDETVEIFRKWFSNVELRKDIHGKDRMIRASNG